MKKLGICCFIFGIYGVSYTSISPLLSEIANTYHIDVEMAGMIINANCIGFLVTTIASGIIGFKRSLDYRLRIAVGGMGLVTFIFGCFHSFWAGYGAMLLVGGFSGLTQSCILSAITEISSEGEEDYNINLSMLCYGVGAFLGPVIAGKMNELKMHWSWMYKSTGILLLLSVICLKHVQFSNRKQQRVEVKRPGIVNIINVPFLLTCFCMMLYTGAELGSWGWLAVFLEKERNFGTFESGLAVALFWGGIVGGRFWFGRLSKQCNSVSLLFCMIPSAVVASWITTSSRNSILIQIGIMGLGFFLSSVWPFLAVLAGKFSGNDTGYSIVIASGGIGSTVTSAILVLVSRMGGIELAVKLPLVFFLIILFLLFLLKKQQMEEDTGRGQIR